MLSILCPHCQTKLTVEEQWRGKTINCLSCGKKLAVAEQASAANVVPAEPALTISTSASPGARQRKKAIGNRIISTLLHLSITAATIYAGYYLISGRQAAKPQKVATPKTETPKSTRPKVVRVSPKRVEPKRAASAIEVAVSTPKEVIVPTVSPFLDAPLQATLPSSGETGIVTLIDGLDGAEFRLMSNSSELTHSDRKIFWRSENDAAPSTVAGLALIEGSLKFRWMAPVPAAAETAIRNSIVRLSSDEHQHVLALRTAESLAPLQIDLKKAEQKLVSKCDFLPATDDICFELTGIDQLPDCTCEGDELARLQVRGQTTLQYLAATGAATRLTMRKRGKVVVVEIENGFALPSGDEQPMSITSGTNKLNDLEAASADISAAEAALPGLRSQLKTLQSKGKKALNTLQRQQLQTTLLTTQQRISYGERLVSQKLAVTADINAIKQVAEVAKQLHETEVPYRFYTVVDGHEVNLLLAK